MKKLTMVMLASVVMGLSMQAIAQGKMKTHRASKAHSSRVQAAKSVGKVNLNTADAQTLSKAVKGIGPKRAEAIVAYREQHGRFKNLDELVNVRGIGKKFMARNEGVLKKVLKVK